MASDPSSPRIFRFLSALRSHDAHLAEVVGDDGVPVRAILRPLPRALVRRPDVVAALRRDLERLAALDHPHLSVAREVVRLQDEGKDQLVLVTDDVPAVDLATVMTLHPPPWPPEVVRGIVSQVARGLTAARALGLAHGDLDAAVITLDADGHVRVRDMAVVRSELSISEGGTSQLSRLALDHTAPERLSSPHPRADGPDDVYALGTLAVRWITGSPFGRAQLRAEAHQARVAELKSRLEGQFGALVRGMLAFDPTARPSAATIAATLGDPSDDLPRWAASRVPNPAPTQASPDQATEVRGPTRLEVGQGTPDEATFLFDTPPGALDPEVTQEPLSDLRTAKWIAIRDRSLASLAHSEPRPRSAPPPPPAPAGGPDWRVWLAGGIGVASLLALAVVLTGAWIVARAALTGPETHFRSGWQTTERMTVTCTDAAGTGERAVRLRASRRAPLGTCTVLAVGEGRTQRRAVVADAQPGTYLCFAVGEAGCVEMTAR